MPVEIFIYDLLDWGGGIEQTKPMTEAEAKEANRLIFEEEERLIRWAKSPNQNKNYERSKINDQRTKA